MATITLTADTNYSPLTVANDDTIDCAGFILTLDEQPTETGVQVTSPGTNGRVVFSGGWNLSTWDFFAGASTTAGMIATLPEGATIKSITSGSGTNNRGVGLNNGTILTVNGGTGASTFGVNTNDGTVITANGGGSSSPGINTNAITGIVTTANGGSAAQAHGVNTNNGTVITANGGTSAGAYGVNANNGTVTTSNGGSVAATHGINTNAITGIVTTANGGSVSNGVVVNNGVIVTANGGSGHLAGGVNANNGTVTTSSGGAHATAYGVTSNNGLCLRLTDNTGKGVGNWQGDTCFVEGPHIAGVIPDNIKTIYSLGTLSGSATIAGDAVVTTLSEGGGASRPSNPFTQQVIG